MAASNASCPPVSPLRLSRARTATRPAPADQALLLQFVVLSLLLHILVILAFGSRSAGSDRRGDGGPGSLDVTLRRLSPEPGTGFTLAPGADSASAGSALLRRLLGRPAPPAKAATPVPPAAMPAPSGPAPAPPEVPPAAPESMAPAAPAPPQALPRLNREAQEEVDRPLIPPAAAPPVERVPAAVPVPRDVPSAAMPQVDIAPREAPLPAPIERVVPAKSRPEMLPPIERLPPAPVERIAPAKNGPELLPPIERPPPAPIEHIAPATSRPELLPPIERPPPGTVERIAPATSRPEVLAPIAPLPREAPPPAPASPSASPAVEPPPAAPFVAPAPRGETLDTAPRAAPAGGAADRAAPREAPTRSGSSLASPIPAARGGIPDAEEEAFKPRGDVADPATVPRIDLEATRKRAREIASEPPGSRGLLLVVPTPPDVAKRKPTLAEGIAKAAKPDCRDAYAELGLLAIAPLVASTIGNGGCRW